jgi:Ni/Fe-hydrogenase subunit HybB-like protein
LLQQFVERGPLASLWFIMLFCSAVVPWALLWKRSWRRTPWLLAVAGILINVGMWLERYIIVPVNLSINRMPFTWRLYIPNVEIPLSVGLFALFALLYMLASRFIPLVPVWEVQEGQESHIIRKIGKAEVSTFSDIG